MMTKTLILFLAVNLAFSNAVLRNLKIGVPPKGKPQNGKTKLCASTCPDCVQCDTKKGICSLPLTGNVCVINSLNGFCSSNGICVASISGQTTPLQKCQTNFCTQDGTCSIVYLNDGSDCTTPSSAFHSFCVNNGCKLFIEALTKTLPAYNIGCNGLPDGILCDTNLNVMDGETCQNGICKFANGIYNGVLQ